MDFGKGLDEWMYGSIEGFAFWVWEFIQSAFSYSDMNGNWWITVVGGDVTTKIGSESTTIHHPGMLNVLVMAAVPVLVIFIVIQLIMSMYRRSTTGMIRAMLAGFFAIPATYMTTGFLFLFIKAMDWLSNFILGIGTDSGEDAAMQSILGLFGMTWNGEANKVALDENYQQWSMARDPDNTGGGFVGLLIMLVVFLCGLFLLVMMTFRTFALMVLAAFAPIAVFSLANDAAKAMFGRWLSVVIGLLLAKPAAAVVMKMGMTLSTTAGDSVYPMAVGIISMIAAGMMPIVAGSFVVFVNNNSHAGIDSAGINHAQSAGRRGMNTIRSSSRSISRGISRVTRRR